MIKRKANLIAGILIAAVMLLSTVHAETTPVSALPQQSEGKKTLLDWRSQPSEVPTLSGMRVVQGLGLCLGVFFLGLYVMKRIRGGAPMSQYRSMRVVERLPIAPKHQLMLVDVEGGRVLLSVGPERTELIREYQLEAPPDSSFEQIRLHTREPSALKAAG